MSKKRNVQKRGRPTEDESLRLRSEALRLLLNKRKESDENVKLTYNEIEASLRIDQRTAREIFNQISEISSDLKFVSGGILVRRETYYHKHLNIDLPLKDAVADKVVDVLPNDVTTVACSGGTTVAICAKRFTERRRYHVFVTNNCGIIDQVAGTREFGTIVLTGGDYNPGVHGFVGDMAIEAFAKARCEAALIGISGINARGELFVRHFEEKAVNKQIIKSTTRYVVVAADINKFNQEDTWQWATIDIDLLNDTQRDLEVYVVTNDPNKLADPRKRDQAQAVIDSLAKAMGVKIATAE